MSARWFVAVALFLGGLAAFRLASLPALPFCNRPASDARFLPLQPGDELVQTITPSWDGFARLRVRLAPDTDQRGEIEVEITGQTRSDSASQPRRARLPLSDATTDGYLDIDFEPFPASRGRTFRVTFRNPGTSSGLALWVNARDTYSGGALSLKGQAGGDLVFVTFSQSHEPVAFLQAMTRGRPWPLSSFWAVLGCVALFAVVSAWLCLDAFGVMRGSD